MLGETMKILLIIIIVCAFAVAQVPFSPQSQFNTTVAGLSSIPASSFTNKYATITDGVGICDTSIGGGTIRVLVISNGSTWAAVNCGGGSGTVTFQTGGSTTATAAQANFVAGTGTLLAGTAPGGNYQLQISPDTTVLPTKANLQAGTSMTLTETSSSSSVYTTTTSPVFSVLPSGASQLPVWSWKVGTSCSGGALTMQVNTLPATPASLLNPDGSNPTTAQCAAGRKLLITYDSVANDFVIVGGEAATASATFTDSYITVPYDTNMQNNNFGYSSGTIACYDKPVWSPLTLTNAYGNLYSGTASSYFGVALYDYGGNRLTAASSTGASVASGGSFTTAFGGGAYTVNPGTAGRVAVCVTSNAGSSLAVGSASTLTAGYVQPSGAPILYTAANAATFSGATITWPSTLGSKSATNNNFPLLLIQ
jgi:hypothetical protein